MESAPHSLRSGPRRLGRAGEQRPQSEPRRWLSRLERRGGEDSGARVSPAHGHTETRVDRGARPALPSRPGPPTSVRLALPTAEPRPLSRPTRSSLATVLLPPELQPAPPPRFRQVRPRPPKGPAPTSPKLLPTCASPPRAWRPGGWWALVLSGLLSCPFLPSPLWGGVGRTPLW